MDERKKKESYDINQGLIGRLRIAMDRVQTNARELAENAQVGRSFVYDILSGKSLNPTTQKLAAVAETLGVSLSYLLYGEESWGGGRREEASHAASDRVSIASLTTEPSASGTSLVSREIEDRPFSFRRNWIEDKLRATPGDLRIVDVRGDSMAPTLAEGDVVLVDLREQSPSPPGVFVLFDGFGLVVKRLELQADGLVRLISDNPQYAPYIRALNETNVIGRVVWFAREF